MELNGFGSVMKFALDLEGEIKSALELAAKNEKLSSLSTTLNGIKELNLRNLKILERTRRENVCEMVLHPITGLNASDYTFSASAVSGMTSAEFNSFLEDASGKISKFYGDAAEKLAADDAKRVFVKLAKNKYSV